MKSFAIAYPHNGVVLEPFARNLAISAALYHPETIIQVSSCNIARNRNRIIELFLTKCQAKNLLMIDTDIEFNPKVIGTLGGHHVEGVVAPLVDGTLNAYDKVGDGVYAPADFRRDRAETKEVAVVGAGMIVISRHVLETMAKKYQAPWQWFGYDKEGAAVLGDDFTFCHRAADSGFVIHATMAKPPIEHWKLQPLC